MNTITTPPLPFLRFATLLTAAAAWLFFSCNGFAAKAPGSTDTAAATTITALGIPRSVFEYRAGKDPFFPNRVLTPVQAPEPARREIMVLKGIAGTLDRRVALINDRTFTKGETGEIKSGTNEYKIRVIDIKDRSVTIERAGQTNEMPLVENLLPLDGRK